MEKLAMKKKEKKENKDRGEERWGEATQGNKKSRRQQLYHAIVLWRKQKPPYNIIIFTSEAF